MLDKNIPAAQTSLEIPVAALLEDVAFSWPGQQLSILNIPHFSLACGEKVFLSGPSGSGKSTLLSLVAGILRPDSGKIVINGVRVDALGGAARDAFRGDNIGLIFQQFNLVPYLSMLDNVLIPCRLSHVRKMRAERQHGAPRAAAESLLRRLGLGEDLWSNSVARLSVGQQQRVAAARALIGSPPLIMADEPTSALDADRRADFLRLLLQECAEAGSSLLFVSHDQSLASAFMRQVCLSDISTPQAMELRV